MVLFAGSHFATASSIRHIRQYEVLGNSKPERFLLCLIHFLPQFLEIPNPEFDNSTNFWVGTSFSKTLVPTLCPSLSRFFTEYTKRPASGYSSGAGRSEEELLLSEYSMPLFSTSFNGCNVVLILDDKFVL